ncbi:MAG: TolC family protein [bacterium]|nr:TolC family protein [bacterium]
MRALQFLSVVLAAGLASIFSSPSSAGSIDGATAYPEEPRLASSLIIASIEDPTLRLLLVETLERNPEIAAISAQARAADQRPAQAGALPDPMLSLTVFLLEPQTRVGPQQASVSLSQRLPWFGKLRLKDQAALLRASAAEAQVEAARLKLVTTVRRLYMELQYLAREERVVIEEQATLGHYEELAQARYASGFGIGQTAIKIQAEITRARTRLLGIKQRRISLLAEINALRDRPNTTLATVADSPTLTVSMPPTGVLYTTAHTTRPEMAAAQALIESSKLRIDLAEKKRRPDVTVGLNYALVGKRNDTIGQLNPPEGNGDDIFGLSGGINLPIWQKKLAAGVEEAVQQRFAAQDSRRAVSAQIEGELADLVRRIPLLQEQLQLFDSVLTVQAEESLYSAEAAYATGTAGALDLLDAERVLLGVRIGAERVRIDLAIAIAQLEGVLASPLEAIHWDRSAA